MKWHRAIAPLVGVAAFLVGWELLVRIRDVRPFVLRAPSDIVRYLARFPGDFLGASGTTTLHALTGFVLALVLAVLAGALLAASPFLERATQPILVLVVVTPFASYIGSVVLWLDGGDAPVRFITTLVCFPPFVFGAVAGMRSADPAARELFASVAASRVEVLWRLRLPSALPSLFTTARFTIGLALIAAYLVEGQNFSDAGLGAIGRRAAALNEADPQWATVFCMAIIGTVWLLVLGALERVVLRWHASQRMLRD
jgi:NitT/TauT family transport system permease protein